MVANAGFLVFAFFACALMIILVVINKVRIVELKQLKWEIVAFVLFWIVFFLIFFLWQS
ncbi:MAG: hypothetical protein GF308_12750 [Candidatus Heimdallarchaeota archaeon]|nr:hypothetical protein [Candidatus Heimdallarchaeota archaeon]